MTKVRMAELTGGEARVLYPRNPLILLPMGSHEDQGPHAPMGDYLSAEAVALRIADRATEAGTEAFVAPVLPFGGADYFGSMPGGISLLGLPIDLGRVKQPSFLLSTPRAEVPSILKTSSCFSGF